MEGARLEELTLELRLEHRLTKLESAIIGNTAAVVDLAEKVKTQNDRVGKLERFQAQIVLAGAFLVGSGPFVFFALDRIFPAK